MFHYNLLLRGFFGAAAVCCLCFLVMKSSVVNACVWWGVSSGRTASWCRSDSVAPHSSSVWAVRASIIQNHSATGLTAKGKQSPFKRNKYCILQSQTVHLKNRIKTEDSVWDSPEENFSQMIYMQHFREGDNYLDLEIVYFTQSKQKLN